MAATAVAVAYACDGCGDNGDSGDSGGGSGENGENGENNGDGTLRNITSRPQPAQRKWS